MKSIISVLLISLLFFACSEPVESNKTNIKVKGTTVLKKSELAVLMRNMYNEFDSLKPLIQTGDIKATEWLSKYHQIDAATPTDSNDSGPVFISFAGGFKERLGLLDQFPDSIALWNAMVASCVDCHKTYCPGPVKTINKLKI